MAVFASNLIKIELDISDPGAAESYAVLKETTGIAKANDGNVVEYDVYGDAFTRRKFTGGKKNDFSFETKLDPTDPVHKFLRKLVTDAGIAANNGRKLKLTFPLADPASATPRTEVYTGVIKPTADGGQASLDLSVLNFDFMSDGKPEITEEAPAPAARVVK